jgi:hypothetical protein
MRLNRLSLTNFRAFARLEMDLDGRILFWWETTRREKPVCLKRVLSGYLASFQPELIADDQFSPRS